MNHPDKLINTAEAARIIGVTPRHVVRYINSGKLKTHGRLGTRTYLLKLGDVQEFAEARRQDGRWIR